MDWSSHTATAKCSSFGFEYQSIKDPYCFSTEKMSESGALSRVSQVLEDVVSKPLLPPKLFHVKNPPAEVDHYLVSMRCHNAIAMKQLDELLLLSRYVSMGPQVFCEREFPQLLMVVLFFKVDNLPVSRGCLPHNNASRIVCPIHIIPPSLPYKLFLSYWPIIINFLFFC